MIRKLILPIIGIFSIFSLVYFFYYFGRDVMDHADHFKTAGFLREDKNDEAIRLIDENIPGHRRDGSLFYFKAVALKNKGLYKEALEELEKSIKLGYPETPSYNLKGLILGEYMRDLEAQIFWTSRSISIDPFDTEAYFVRARAYAASGRDEKALADLDSAIYLDQSDLSFLRERAAVLIRMKRYGDAIVDMRKVAARYPEDPDIWLGLYNAYLGAGLYSNAFYCISRAISLAPKDPVYIKERAFFWEGLGNYYQAYKDMTRALDLHGKDSPSYVVYFLSKQLYRLNQQKEALKYVNLAISMHGANLAMLYDLRGRIHFQQGKVKEAVKDWAKSAGMGNVQAEKILAFLRTLPETGSGRESERIKL